MSVVKQAKVAAVKSISELYNLKIEEQEILVNATKQEFEGDYTVVLFSLIKQLRKSPESLGEEIGSHLVANNPQLFSAFNVIKGFLNLTISTSYWTGFLTNNFDKQDYAKQPESGHKVMIEYASPNTNKPLHLGHLRNIFLGWSMSEIFKYTGNKVVKTCIANDRGIHICKSMVSWQLFANGATPQVQVQKATILLVTTTFVLETNIKKKLRRWLTTE